MIRKYFKKDFIAFIISLCALDGFTSCSVDVPPPDLYSDPDAITTVQSARSLLTSCYLLYPHYEFEFSILGNDFCLSSLSGKNIDQQNLYNWQDKDISTMAADVWLAYYNCIANCDVLLERMPDVSNDNPAAKNAIMAEVKTLKAMCYFQLLRLYAQPYAKGEDADGIVLKNHVGLETPGRSSIARCTSYIRTLLTEAAAVENTPNRNGWLSQKAAINMLAELELYAGRYEEAAGYAKQLLDAMPDGALAAANYYRLWEAATYEGRIFAFNTTSTYYNGIQYDAKEGDYFALNPDMILKEGDTRKATNEYVMTMAGEERILMGKYNRRNKLELTTSYVEQMRYANTLFIYAEAMARTGKEDEARTRLNAYLTEMGASALDEALTGEALVKAILAEKYREFAGEGRNWFDLKRTLTSIPRLTRWGASKSAIIQATDYRWTFPIPSSEYKYNEAVTPNEGWPLNR